MPLASTAPSDWSISARRSGFWCGSFGLLVVGGEWFQVWQSQTWNGQQAAFRFYVTILAALIFVNRQDADPPKG
jgi:predicted small integral membrane protein